MPEGQTVAQAIFKPGTYRQFELGMHAGNDKAPWSGSVQINGLAMVLLGITDNKNAIYGGVKAFGSSDYTRQHDDLQPGASSLMKPCT